MEVYESHNELNKHILKHSIKCGVNQLQLDPKFSISHRCECECE